jgi:hypothetical protein
MTERVSLRFLGASAVLLLLGSTACKKDAAPSAASVEGAASPAAAPAGSSAATANYTATIALPAGCKKAQTCRAEVVLVTKGEYHINESYPYKFKASDPAPAGVRYAKAVVGRDDGRFEAKKAVLPVEFTVDAAGEAKIGGTLSLSVCSAANCLMDKQTLDLMAKVE